jgi:hypothetical protein
VLVWVQIIKQPLRINRTAGSGDGYNYSQSV